MEHNYGNDQKTQFTPEEMEILTQCNNEATQRGMFWGFAMGGVSFVAFKKSLDNKKYAFPATIVCSTLGYILGKISYIPICLQRVAQMPNNSLSKAMEERMQPRNPRIASRQQQQQQQLFEDKATDFGTVDSNTFNEISSHDGFTNAEDTSFNDGQNEGEAESYPVKPAVSYAELRQKNREEYLRARAEKFAQISVNQPSRRVMTTPKPESPNGSSAINTKYGDIWDE